VRGGAGRLAWCTSKTLDAMASSIKDLRRDRCLGPLRRRPTPFDHPLRQRPLLAREMGSHLSVATRNDHRNPPGPTWLWVLGSMYFEGRARTPPRDNWYRAAMKSPTVRAFGAFALLLLAVLLTGHAIGWASGSLRVLPNGVHQVSTSS
jgi:hypothetical protein